MLFLFGVVLGGFCVFCCFFFFVFCFVFFGGGGGGGGDGGDFLFVLFCFFFSFFFFPFLGVGGGGGGGSQQLLASFQPLSLKVQWPDFVKHFSPLDSLADWALNTTQCLTAWALLCDSGQFVRFSQGNSNCQTNEW